LPQPNANDYTGKSDANANGNYHTTTIDTYADGYGNHHATSISYPHGDRDGDNHAEANANAKAAAHAASSSDSVGEWVKKLKELQSNRELARQLASSLLFRGSAARS